MNSTRTELPVLRVYRKDMGRSVDFREARACDSRCSSHTWRQERSHTRRDEVRLFRTDWKRKNVHDTTRVPASTSDQTRKRKRNEWTLQHCKKQCIDIDGSESHSGDSERDSVNMDDQLSAFVEYNATDMDSLDINPSQDFDGDMEQETDTQALQCSSWKDVTDVNQFHEEASEVFDNVIYAPQQCPKPVCSRATKEYGLKEHVEFGIARSVLPSSVKVIPAKVAVICPSSDDSEGSLSDGFDVALNLSRKQELKSYGFMDTAASLTSDAEWKQRRSVKRDCSFIDSSNSYSGNRQLLLMASSSSATTNAPSECVIELKDGCFDLSDDVQNVPKRTRNVPSSGLLMAAAVPTVVNKVVPSAAPYIGALQPRLVRKRRKGGQLTLDGFLRSK